MTDNRPVHSINLGTIQVSIWQNDSELGRMYRMSLCRVYKDNEKWGRSPYFSQFDIPLLCRALQLCQDWIRENTKEDDVIRLPRIDVEEDKPATVNH